MILMLLVYQIKTASVEHNLPARWKAFSEKHLIADDPYDEQTMEFRERERDKEADDREL